MTFEHPTWLALAPLLGLLAAALVAFGWRKRNSLLGQFAAPRLLESLTEKTNVSRLVIKTALLVSAICAVCVGLARPQYGVEWSERKARGLDIVFALDSSRSMLATDLRPTRLERAKLAILDLIDRLESDRIGLVAFAGQAFLQTPPTLDYGAFRESLNATDPSVLSRGGSDLGRAIEEAANAFPSENNVKIVVLLTDGEDLSGRAIKAARAAADDGIRIYAIGIGTPEGEYLRIRNAQGIEEFVRDSGGQPVRSQLDEGTLRELAQITGGSYTQLGSGSLESLYDSVLASLPREERESELQEVRIERFQWLIGAAVLFLVFEILIRGRGQIASKTSLLLLTLFFPPTGHLEAQTLTDREAYNEAHAALIDGDYSLANQRYTQAMQESSDRELQRDALFNMGHATYQQGMAAYNEGDIEAALDKIQSAEALFQSARDLGPDDKSIAKDLELTQQVREAIEQIIEQQEKQDSQKSEDSQEQEQQEGEESEESSENSEQDQGTENQEGQSEDSEQSQQSESSQQSSEESAEDGQNSESASQDEQGDEESSKQAETREEDASNQTDDENESSSSGDEPTSEEDGQEPVPQVNEADESQDPEGDPASQSVTIEGMTIEEAQDLLDSLRGKEEILPFAKPVPGKGRQVQDW